MSINKLHSLRLILCGLSCGLSCTLITFNLTFAQTVTGTITGTVFDAADKVISGARVKVLDERTGSLRIDQPAFWPADRRPLAACYAGIAASQFLRR